MHDLCSDETESKKITQIIVSQSEVNIYLRTKVLHGPVLCGNP